MPPAPPPAAPPPCGPPRPPGAAGECTCEHIRHTVTPEPLIRCADQSLTLFAVRLNNREGQLLAKAQAPLALCVANLMSAVSRLLQPKIPPAGQLGLGRVDKGQAERDLRETARNQFNNRESDAAQSAGPNSNPQAASKQRRAGHSGKSKTPTSRRSHVTIRAAATSRELWHGTAQERLDEIGNNGPPPKFPSARCGRSQP